MKKSLLTVMMAGLMIFSAVSTFAKSNEVDKIVNSKDFIEKIKNIIAKSKIL